MNYIVLDLEWNQPCHISQMRTHPVTLHGEIIQIGAVKLDENYHILDTFKIMVAPRYYTRMHHKVSKLTGITGEELQYGLPFRVALGYFKKWCGDEFTFLIWGEDDMGILRSNLRLHGLDEGWLPRTYNLQVIFDDQITKEKRQVSLSYAMEKLGEPPLKAHDALNDAKNTVCVCLHLDMIKGLAEYAELKERMQCPKANRDVRVSAKTYTGPAQAIQDPEQIRFHCPICGGSVTCGDFVHQNASKIIAIGKCDNGDELFVRFKFTRDTQARFRVSRIIYEMDEENKAYYISRKQASKEKMRRRDQRRRTAALCGCDG